MRCEEELVLWDSWLVEQSSVCWENGGGPVGEENSSERYEVERKVTNGMDGRYEKKAEWKRNVCGVRKDDCVWWKWMESNGECMINDVALTTNGEGSCKSGMTLGSY